MQIVKILAEHAELCQKVNIVVIYKMYVCFSVIFIITIKFSLGGSLKGFYWTLPKKADYF